MHDETLLPEKPEQPGGEIILYPTEDGRTRIQVRMEGETVWLTIAQMAELFQVDKSGISRHLNNVHDMGGLFHEATVAKFATVRVEDERSVQRELEYYNLNAIISAGSRQLNSSILPRLRSATPSSHLRGHAILLAPSPNGRTSRPLRKLRRPSIQNREHKDFCVPHRISIIR